jgi:hypothetical protein
VTVYVVRVSKVLDGATVGATEDRIEAESPLAAQACSVAAPRRGRCVSRPQLPLDRGERQAEPVRESSREVRRSLPYEMRTAALRERRRIAAMRTLVAGAALGTMLIASVAAAASGAAKPRTLATRGPVTALAADGDRAALVVSVPYVESRGYPGFGCASVVVWEPTRRRVVRLKRPCGPNDEISRREGTHGVALAGTRAAWLHVGGGHTLETVLETATLARPRPASRAYGASYEGGDGDFVREPVGDGALLAFTVDRRCDAHAEQNEGPGAENQCPPGRNSGYVVAATVWRVGGRSPCPDGRVGPRACRRVASADGELSVLAVDAGRIVVRTESGVRLLTAGGAVLQEFDLRARSAALSGNRLAVRTADAVEVYDTNSGQRTAWFPAASALRLQDLDRDILVTATGGTVTLRRLGDGRTSTIRAGRTALAQLERPGLFVARGRRVTFTPIRDVLRRLDE